MAASASSRTHSIGLLMGLALLLLATPLAAGPRDFLVDAEWLAAHRADPKLVILDVRYHPHRYLTLGHIPGAVNVVSLDGTDAQSQKWLPEVQLGSLYQAVPKERTVYVYCHDSFRSTLAYAQLKSLGYRDVRVYNGGWAHWGNTLTLPVVQGEAPYDEEFAL